MIAGLVVDFDCADLGLAIELDGGVHDREGGPESDAEWDAVLLRHGVRVLRFRNEEVSVDAVRRVIAGAP